MSIELSSLVHDVADYPQPGVLFKDITPLLASAEGFREAVDRLVESAPPRIDLVLGMEARGFLFAAPVALALGAGLVPIRKPGKLPGEIYRESFELEYGLETLTMRVDAIHPGARVLIVDDVLATGGTVAATAALAHRSGAELAGVSVVVELSQLGGRQRLAKAGIDRVTSVLHA